VCLVEETPWRWRIDRSGAMGVPGIVFASSKLLPDVAADRSLEQVVNVATLPGIVGASYAMPDVHWGYGAGRAMSRTAARKRTSGAALRRELATAGVEVRAGSNRGLAEEAPFSYKDVDAVVETVERAGLARRAARLVPIGVVKG
jgi:RNA-splicing ligase RtcB